MDHALVSLPADGRAAGMARSVVRSRLREWHLDELLDSAMLLISEVVTNVIVHTASAPELELSRAGAGVLVSIVDGSPVPPRRRLHSATATTGRGLRMLRQRDVQRPLPIPEAAALILLLDRQLAIARSDDD